MFDIESYAWTARDDGANVDAPDLKAAILLIEPIQPKVIVEIGTAKGGSARLWRDYFKPEILISVDINQTAPDIEGVSFLTGAPSQDPGVVREVKRLLNGRYIDLLFIDGGHLYSQVKADFEIYSTLVRPDGLVLMHDTMNLRVGQNEVLKYWTELKAIYPYVEIVGRVNSSGLGVVYL